MKLKWSMKKQFETGAVVILTLVLIVIVTFFPINLKFLNSFKNAFYDFKFSDIYYNNLKESKEIDENILIINIGNNDREEIAQSITKISKYQPKTIALDALFLELKNPYQDSVLAHAINYNKVIIASFFEHDSLVTSDSYFGEKNGYVNFYQKGSISVVRKFLPFKKKDGDIYNSFSAEILKKSYPQKYHNLIEHKEHKMEIKYSGNIDNYIVLDYEDVFNNSIDLSILKDKIVLLGYLGENLQSQTSIEDKFFSPLNSKYVGKSFPDMYGIVIHANILSMMISESYVGSIPRVIEIVLSLLIAFIVTSLFISDYIKKPMWFHFKAKVIQLILMMVLLYVELLLFSSFNIRLNLTLGIVIVLLAVDVIYFYDGLVKYLHKKYNFKSIFLHSSH